MGPLTLPVDHVNSGEPLTPTCWINQEGGNGAGGNLFVSQGVVQVAGNATTEAQATVDPIFKPAGGGVAGRPGLHDL